MSAKMKRVRATPRSLDGLANLVTSAREAMGASVVDAARDANVSRSTWVRVERGEKVRPYNLGRMEAYLSWAPGSINAWLTSNGPVPGEPASSAPVEQTPRQIIEGLKISADRKRRLLAVYDADEPDG